MPLCAHGYNTRLAIWSTLLMIILISAGVYMYAWSIATKMDLRMTSCMNLLKKKKKRTRGRDQSIDLDSV